MTNETMLATSTLVVEICCNCGTAFAWEESLRRARVRYKDTFYCPNGHPQVFRGESMEQELAKVKQALKNESVSKIWWQDEAESKAKSLSATKGHLTKTKKRIANGVCPCCKRQFEDLQRHMKTKHPKYGGT